MMENETIAAPEAAPAKKRGRPARAEKKAAPVVVDAPIAVAEKPVVAPPDIRADMRPAMREEDSRVRAARRTAEIRDHLGTLDDGTDDFYIDPRMIPAGWEYEWKRMTVFGQEDPAYRVHTVRKGWENVPLERHPEMMPSGHSSASIERKGMVLMERPKELSDEARDIERRKARDQVRHKEQQLNSAPDGQFGRDHREVKPKINKTYESIPIPKD